jgi:hypothetical protein
LTQCLAQGGGKRFDVIDGQVLIVPIDGHSMLLGAANSPRADHGIHVQQPSRRLRSHSFG